MERIMSSGTIVEYNMLEQFFWSNSLWIAVILNINPIKAGPFFVLRPGEGLIVPLPSVFPVSLIYPK